MATEDLKRQRLEERFRMWDNDGDGRIERTDLEQEARDIIEAFGAPEDSPKARALKEGYSVVCEEM